jgi:cell wall-associated NlpC family hydrolase
MTSPLDTLAYWKQEDQKKRGRVANWQQENQIRPWTAGVDYQTGFDQRNQTITQTSQSGVQAAQTVAAQRKSAAAGLKARQDAQRSQWAQQDIARQYQVAMWKQQQAALQRQRELDAAAKQYGQQAQQAAGRSGYTQTAGATVTGNVGQYSNPQYNQIATWARQAGWSEQDIPTVIGIAMAESSGNPGAVNNSNSNGTSDYGLMQINSSHGDLLKSGSWSDPVANMRMAKAVYDSQGWGAWTTYNSGAAAKFGVRPTSYKVQTYQTVSPSQTVNTPNGLRNTIVTDAMGAIGLPYVWGASDLSAGVDCSGLVQAVYAKAGVPVPQRSAGGGGRAQSQVTGLTMGGGNISGRITTIQNLQPGDLIGWTHKYAGPNWVGHIAIYAGNGQIIEAAGDGIPVARRPLRPSDYTYAVPIHLTLPGD